MLYIWIISLIFYRYTFFPLLPSDLAPPYWINMGAVAISTLAGALLVLAAPASPLLTGLLPFLKGLTLLFWATATWWIPMLLILGTWRHVVQGFPFGTTRFTGAPSFRSGCTPSALFASRRRSTCLSSQRWPVRSCTWRSSHG